MSNFLFRMLTAIKRTDDEPIIINEPMAKKAKSPPEIICLSDDDDIIDTNTTDVPIVTPTKEPESPIVVKNETNSVSNWIIQDKDIIHTSPLPSKYTDVFKKAFEIRCSSIRFGIVEFNVDTEVIRMQPSEFEMNLTGGFLENVNMKLAYSDITQFFFSFESQTPVALIQVRSEFARLFDRYIPTSDEHGRGFDPNSKDEKRRRVIFLLKTLTPDMERIHISTIYHFLKSKAPKMEIRCISGTRAQELYNLARYAKVLAPAPKLTPFFLNAIELTAKTVGLNNNTVRFDLSPEDLHCLNEGEFLNDNIIDFYLQYIYYEKLSEEDRQRTYLLNSFFYKRLTQKSNGDVKISAAERRYNRVRRWFRDVDLFSKSFLLIPINQNAHWYIVLIQNPSNVPTESDLISEDEDVYIDDRSKSKKKRRSARVTHHPDHDDINTKSNTDPIEVLDDDNDADEVASDDDVPLKVNIESLVNSKNRTKSPAIIIFDSLRIASKTRVAATLREFLQLEYDHKKVLPMGSLDRKLFNLDTIQTIEAAVPQQKNYSDCGLYVLQYIESYFLHRASKMNLPLCSTFSEWCEKNLKGSTKRKEILNVINEHVITKDI